jgi:hypothetical protein
MTTAKPPSPKPSGRARSETVHDQRTALVREMMAKESAALDAKTARLKALRLEKEAAQTPRPKPPAARPKKKKT